MRQSRVYPSGVEFTASTVPLASSTFMPTATPYDIRGFLCDMDGLLLDTERIFLELAIDLLVPRGRIAPPPNRPPSLRDKSQGCASYPHLRQPLRFKQAKHR